MTVIVTDLTKTFQMGQTVVTALDSVTLSITEGEFAVAMGPSGSGKSTLLTLVGGLERPTGGIIEVFGQRLDTLNENDLAHYRREVVGFVFQSFHLIPTMTALENVALPLRFAGFSRRQCLEQAMQLLEEVGLSDRTHHRPLELSGGQQQRVAVARALVHRPRLILADEPTGNLDTASGFAVMSLLAGLHQQGSTILTVTHDPRMRAFATQLIHMIDGQTVDEAAFETAMRVLE